MDVFSYHMIVPLKYFDFSYQVVAKIMILHFRSTQLSCLFYIVCDLFSAHLV